MKQDEEIEMLLWDFIDGRCDATEQMRIQSLIASDSVWKLKYDELQSLHQNIQPGLEQPSMRFTKNVMEAIAHTQIAPATKKYINPYIVRGIAAFFIISIASVLLYALSITDVSTASTPSIIPFNTSKFHFAALFNSNTTYAIILVNIVLGLVLIDSMLRRRRIQEY